MPSVATPPLSERRRTPRVPLAMPARLTRRRTSARGFVRDASEGGLLIGLTEPLLELTGDATVEVAWPSAGLRRLRVAEIRRDVDAAGDVVVALRLLDPPGEGGGYAPSMPEPPDRAGALARPGAVVRADLCALGGAAWELAMSAPERRVPDHLARWLAGLAAEIGAPPPEPPQTPRRLLDAIRSVAARP